MNKVEKIALVVLVMALLGVANVALAGGDVYNEYHGDVYQYYYSTPPYDSAPPKQDAGSLEPETDIRLKIAEAERLKAEYHYYALSGRPADIAETKIVGAELNSALAEIDDWYGVR